MKNKQTILYTLLGIMFGVVIGIMTINSANAVDMKGDAYSQVKGCQEGEEGCDCGDSCEDGKDCECKKCDHETEASCDPTSKSCGL